MLERRGIKVMLMYSMTEAGNQVSLTNPLQESESGRMSNGVPLPGVDVKICNHETSVVLPPNTAGEICFRGWNTFVEYDHMPEATAAVFDSDGFFHTGDYGWIDDDGRLYYRGRYSMMIKSGGENVSVTEVEDFLISKVPSIRSAAVVGIPDDKWGEAVVAFVERAEGGYVDDDQLRAACKGRLAGYKIPRKFIALGADEWPAGSTGKIDRLELRRRAIADTKPDRRT
jgi:acyl-CoA synthetase (AMP-forming)/AMP-acid ligase II